jgi:hypothetical protein
MQRTGHTAIVALGALLSWVMLGQLILVKDVGSRSPFDPWRLLLYVLLVAAPLLTFTPLARWAQAPFYDIEATLAWATFGFVVAVVSPADPPSLAQFLLFLLPLTVALATLATLGSYLAGLRIYRGDPRRYDFVRARRQGYLAAFVLVACMLLFSIGTLSPTSAVLLLVIAILAEMFALTRDSQRVRRTVSRSL